MSNFKEITPEEYKENVFNDIGKKWMLITAAKDGKVNTMTASWGNMGVMWGKDIVSVFIRQTRFTKEFVDNADCFSISFLDHEKYAKELSYLGTVSGRDEDKINKANLHVEFSGDVPYIEEADDVMICKKMFRQTMEPDAFIDKEALEKWYSDKNYHDMYMASIEHILEKK